MTSSLAAKLSRTSVVLLGAVLLAACTREASPDEVPGNIASAVAPSLAAPSDGIISQGQTSLLGSTKGLALAGKMARFGSSHAEAVALAEVAGARSEPPQLLEECSAGPLVTTRVGDLLLLGSGEQFVGWHMSEDGPPQLSTDGGVTIGTTREALHAAHDVEVFESTVGTEFYTDDGLGGLLSDASADATVTHLWAGTTCIMR